MATFLDRRALKKIFDAATALRKADTRVAEGEAAVYLVRGEKSKGRPLQALQTLHSAAVDAFGGLVGRELPDGLVAAFHAPIDALRAALHALHSVDLVSDVLEVPPCRVAVVHGPAMRVERPFHDVSGPAVARAGKILGRAAFGEVVIETALYTSMRADIEGHADIEIAQPRRGKLPGLGAVATITLKPIGLKPDREVELLDVDAELRARPRR